MSPTQKEARGWGLDRPAARADGGSLDLFLAKVFLCALPTCLSLLPGSAILASGPAKCMGHTVLDSRG